jgi:hypothetical protein
MRIDFFRNEAVILKKLGMIGCVVLAQWCGSASLSAANEIGGNLGWGFRGTADRSVAVSSEDMRQRHNGSYYQQWNVNNTYNTYNSSSSVINGNQTNCTLSAAATGNQGTTSSYASTASPAVTSTPQTSAYATGNQSNGSYSGAGGTLTAPLNSVQDSYGSPVGSGVTGTVSSAGVGQLSSGLTSSSQVLNSNQGSTGSPTVATVSRSSACSGSVGGQQARGIR